MRTGITIFTAFKYYDFMKYVTLTNDSMIFSVILISKRWFDGLPADLQKIVLEETQTLHKPILDWTKDFNERSHKIWTDNGGELIKLPSADRAELMKRLATVGPEVVKDKPGVKKIYDLMIEMAEKHR